RGVRVSGRGSRKSDSRRHDQHERAPRSHAIARLPDASTASATRMATIATISAAIPPVELELPPRLDTAFTVGAGVSELSGPDQATILPFEYVCLTANR